MGFSESTSERLPKRNHRSLIFDGTGVSWCPRGCKVAECDPLPEFLGRPTVFGVFGRVDPPSGCVLTRAKGDA